MTSLTVEQYFGRTMGNVNHLVLRIFMLGDPPEWLRGRPTLRDLPRFEVAACDHIVPVGRDYTATDYAQQIVWIVENLQFGWSINGIGWAFENENEAIHFRLAF